MAGNASKPTMPFARAVREAGSVFLMLALLVVARTSFANHYVVPSGSMEHTLQPGDRVVVDMSAYGLRVPFTGTILVERGQPQRGDVAVFPSPVDGTRLIKRVVAVGGDRISVIGGRVAINGRPVGGDGEGETEVFGLRRASLNLDRGGGPDIFDATIPPGQVLVMGDHRGDSIDGRFFGLVPSRTLYGRAEAVYWRRGEGLMWKRL